MKRRGRPRKYCSEACLRPLTQNPEPPPRPTRLERTGSCKECGESFPVLRTGPVPHRCDQCLILHRNERARRNKAGRWSGDHLKRKYGLTQADFDRIWSEQGGRCPICSVVLERGRSHRSAACVDHDHATGRVRGLLCNRCNVGMGHFEDDAALLARAIAYLGIHGQA